MAEDRGSLDALLGEGSEFEGKLAFEGTVRIDGSFRGEIASDGTLVVGPKGRLEAEISVGEARIHGRVEGDVVASRSVELMAGSTLLGTVQTPALVVERGAILDGNCKMQP